MTLAWTLIAITISATLGGVFFFLALVVDTLHWLRQQQPDTTDRLVGADEWLRSNTPIYDQLAVEHLRADLDNWGRG